MKRVHVLPVLGLLLGLLLPWLAPSASAQATVYAYDGAGNLTSAKSTLTDPLNCGSVGHVCPAGNACCSGVCVDTSQSPSNCGTCGKVCTSKFGPICYQSVCIRFCPADTCEVGGTCTGCFPPPETMRSTKP